MAVEETITTSWGARLKQSIVGIGTGAAMIAALTGALFWNEGRAVQTSRSLSEGAGIVQSRPADAIDPAFNGKLIHVSGTTSATGPLLDPDFGFAFDGMRLTRKVEMYQWVQKATTETTKNTGGSETQTTTYSYAPAWNSSWQDPAEFKEPAGHHNPPMAYRTLTTLAQDPKLGAYGIEADAVDQLGSGPIKGLTEAELTALRQKQGFYTPAQLDQGVLYLGRDLRNPQIGDYRITYNLQPFQSASIVGRQHDSGIARYRTDSGDALLLVELGNRDAKDMFATAASGNSSLTWIIRIGAVLGLIIGFGLILRPLSVLVSVLPFLGSIMGAGTGILATVMGVALGSVVIALAWFVYRPLLSVAVLAIAGALIAALVWRGKSAKAAKA